MITAGVAPNELRNVLLRCAEPANPASCLLADEIELRRHIERVAGLRRALPLGGMLRQDYRVQDENGPVRFSDLFGGKQTLAAYSMMYGPQRERSCPMCTSLLSAWDGEALDIEQRIALAVVARSPIERIIVHRAASRLKQAQARRSRREVGRCPTEASVFRLGRELVAAELSWQPSA